MKNVLKKHWVLFVSIMVLWCSIVIFLVSSLKLNNGHFCYPLDDIYIHLSIAKNFIIHGNWGVDKYGFESATSSPLWTLLISGVYLLFGVNEYCPLIMNIILATILVSFIFSILKKKSVPNPIVIISLFSIIFFTPLLPLIFLGMEHVMHALLTVIFVSISVEVLSKNKINSQYYLFLVIISPLLTTIRYESLFLIFIICSLMFIRKKYFYSLLLGAVSIDYFGQTVQCNSEQSVQ